MAYVVIGVVLLIIIAPIIAILPSAQQRAQMAKRKQAMKAGLRVELTRIEDPDPDTKYISNTGKPLERKLSVVAYRIQRPRPMEWRRMPHTSWAVRRIRTVSSANLVADWIWEIEPHVDIANDLTGFVKGRLTGLPNDVVRVEEKKFTLSVYWKETGDVTEVIDFLKGCVGIQLHPPDEDDLVENNYLE